jgi:hypothetical protein
MGLLALAFLGACGRGSFITVNPRYEYVSPYDRYVDDPRLDRYGNPVYYGSPSGFDPRYYGDLDENRRSAAGYAFDDYFYKTGRISIDPQSHNQAYAVVNIATGGIELNAPGGGFAWARYGARIPGERSFSGIWTQSKCRYGSYRSWDRESRNARGEREEAKHWLTIYNLRERRWEWYDLGCGRGVSVGRHGSDYVDRDGYVHFMVVAGDGGRCGALELLGLDIQTVDPLRSGWRY